MQLREENEALMESLVRTKVDLAETEGNTGTVLMDYQCQIHALGNYPLHYVITDISCAASCMLRVCLNFLCQTLLVKAWQVLGSRLLLAGYMCDVSPANGNCV